MFQQALALKGLPGDARRVPLRAAAAGLDHWDKPVMQPRRNRNPALVAAALLIVLAVAAAPTWGDDARLLERARAAFGSLPVPDGPPDAVEELGRDLFFDTRLGRDGRTGCVSCHLPERWGADGRNLSQDARGRLSERNAPTVFNAALLPRLRWRGDRDDLAHQAEDSIKGSMGYSSAGELVPVLRELAYGPRFERAFPGAGDPLTLRNFALALAAYQRRLVTPAPVDRFLAGDTRALSRKTQAGLALFLDRGCAACHAGPLFGGELFRRFGLVRDYLPLTGSTRRDPGRQALTGSEADRDVFRVPSLRSAIHIMGSTQVGIELAEAEVEAIADFLEALTGSVPDLFAASPSAIRGGRRY